MSAKNAPLLEDKQLRLPNSLRKLPAPWGGRLYSQLDIGQKEFVDFAQIDAFVITEVDNPDEIRDLFIRLQSGTALNRQQVRDAWPGTLGPYIESLAGKLDRQPTVRLFGLIDRRGDKGDSDVDRFTVNRQVCAQLLALYLARSRDPLGFQSVTADDLDLLYHANTEFVTLGPSAVRFKDLLEKTAEIFESVQQLAAGKGNNKRKHGKLEIFSVFFLLQDLTSNPNFKFEMQFKKKIAERVMTSSTVSKPGKTVTGRAIQSYYEQWREKIPEELGLHLDAKRLFDDKQKATIFSRQQGKCAMCSLSVEEGDAEYDHFPVAHYMGGKTEVDNGRLVCSKCHPRGRPVGEPE